MQPFNEDLNKKNEITIQYAVHKCILLTDLLRLYEGDKKNEQIDLSIGRFMAFCHRSKE